MTVARASLVAVPDVPTGDDMSLDRLTEAGAAERFARLHGADVRFDHRRGHWLHWQAHRWVPDSDERITRVGLAFARAWQHEAIDIPDRSRREDTLKTALKLERRDALVSMLRLAAALPPIADSGDRWDRDAWLLGAPNGVIDLRTGALRDGCRADHLTMSVAVEFDTEAACPRWERFVDEVFDGDADLVAFVRRAAGYSLTGATHEQCLFILYGTGSNGKGSLTNTLQRLLGDFAWCMPFSTIELRDRAAIPNDLAALAGRRFVTASETNDGARLNEARVKALTGCDPVTARFLHKEFFTFAPVAKFWVSVNHKPVVRDDSHGFWRRVRLVPFSRRFDVDAGLADALAAEASGILAWAVRGCLEWQRHGLQPPATVTDATADYERDSDPLGDFIASALDDEPESEIRASELYEHFRKWARHHGLTERETLSATLFGRKAAERFRSARRRGGRVYLDIARRDFVTTTREEGDN